MSRTFVAALTLLAGLSTAEAYQGYYAGQGFRGNYSPGYGGTHGYGVRYVPNSRYQGDYVGRRSTGYYPNSTTRYHYTSPRVTNGSFRYGGNVYVVPSYGPAVRVPTYTVPRYYGGPRVRGYGY